MVIRGLVAASCVVLALAAPARAEIADDCTTDLLNSLVSREPGDPSYTIVEGNPGGSITIHPQNVQPAVVDAANRLQGAPSSIAGAIVTWVDCVV